MNRILLDNIKEKTLNKENNELRINLNEDQNILINKSGNYVFNITDCNVNLLFIVDNEKCNNITFNLNNSNLVLNCFNKNIDNILINSYLNNNSSIKVYNSIITEKDSNVDIFTYHNDCHTNSDIKTCGLTNNLGSINLKVTSKVYKDSMKCIVNQDNKIISFDENNKNSIDPVLLIDCYDVSAKHGAFIGKFKEKDIFYLTSRGIRKDDAYNLLVEGYLIGVMDIDIDEKEKLKNKIDVRR